MTWQVWIPLFVAILGMVGGAFLYQVQKAVDRRNQIKQERRLLYRQFVTAHSDLEFRLLYTDNSDDQFSAARKLDQTIAEVYVSAPDSVVAACRSTSLLFSEVGVQKYPKNDVADEDQFKNARVALHENYLNVVEAMRADTFEETKITRKVLESVLQNALFSLGRLPF